VFRLGRGSVIAGWEAGISGMQRGRTAKADHSAELGLRKPQCRKKSPRQCHVGV
jgi:FKBP-type peptidyl-prolyl cis-trans isomerase